MTTDEYWWLPMTTDDYRKDYRKDYQKDYQKDYSKDLQKDNRKDYQEDYQKYYLKRSIDLRWLFNPVLSLILRWSCFPSATLFCNYDHKFSAIFCDWYQTNQHYYLYFIIIIIQGVLASCRWNHCAPTQSAVWRAPLAAGNLNQTCPWENLAPQHPIMVIILFAILFETPCTL